MTANRGAVERGIVVIALQSFTSSTHDRISVNDGLILHDSGEPLVPENP